LDSLVTTGSPGPLYALDPGVVPIIAGDQDTPVPSAVSVAAAPGAGRIVAIGHEGSLTNEGIVLFDNLQFAVQAMAWLDSASAWTAAVTTGHAEWLSAAASLTFRSELTDQGWSVDLLGGSLTPAALSPYAVVVVGNAWGDLEAQEVFALRDHVLAGGGLLLAGLGWSWVSYHPGETLDDYPMNVLGQEFGVRWIDGVILDPTDQWQGSTVFHTFHPNLEPPTSFADAVLYIEQTTSDHPTDLPAVLASNTDVRRRYSNSHLFLFAASQALPEDATQRQELHDFHISLFQDHPQYYGKGPVFDAVTEATMAWLRERAHRTVVDVLDLDAARVQEIGTAMGLTAQYASLWTDHGLLLLDNTSLDNPQKNYIENYMNAVPATLHDLRSMSVRDFLGTTDPEITLAGVGSGSVNIFGLPIGAASENSFPPDVPPGVVDVFSIVVAHELNHVVDVHQAQTDPQFPQRRDQLIANAGSSHLNYLRSMFPDGFFQQYPREFFASISNQWFTDSGLTLELGITRFDAGYLAPINQALFFANVYSLGGSTTPFYQTDVEGHLSVEVVRIGRDVLGRLTDVWYGGEHFSFQLDGNGDVTGYTRETVTAVPEAAPATVRPELLPNAPNPFRSVTSIRLRVPDLAPVTLRVYDVRGSLVRTLVDRSLEEGEHEVLWDGRDEEGLSVSSGVYLTVLEARSGTRVRRIVVVR
jgi:hypothetical protein